MLVHLVASPKGEAISDSAQGECRTFQIVPLSVCVCIPVCLSVNNAARCILHLLRTI